MDFTDQTINLLCSLYVFPSPGFSSADAKEDSDPKSMDLWAGNLPDRSFSSPLFSLDVVSVLGDIHGIRTATVGETITTLISY